MGIEFELKFRATPEALTAMAKAISGRMQVFQMETTYYDTPTGALSQRRYTLRRRMENDLSVCTLKTPAEGFGRREFEVNSPELEAALPELCKLSGLPELPGLLQEGVVPLCGARFDRRAITVSLEDCILEVALDEGVLTGGGKTQKLCEAEVELKKGSREAAVKYAKELAERFGLVPESRSKFSRAKALAKGEENGTV